MNREDFEQEILRHLREQQELHPFMEPQDVVKFVFQAMLGVGHLLSARGAVEAYITRETDQLSAGGPEPQYEVLSPSWCRLSLRGAKEKGITPSVIAGLMLSSGTSGQFTRGNVREFCERLAASGWKPAADPELLKRLPDEKRTTLLKILEEDPRPAYHDDPDRIYGFPYAGMEVRFRADDRSGTVFLTGLTDMETDG